MIHDDDQEVIAHVLASMPPLQVSADFLARVNARIDDTAGWFGLADFRRWTLRLAPAAAALALIAVLWPAPATSASKTATATIDTTAVTFSPASAADWQSEVSADALLDAALQSAAGSTRVR